MNFDGLDQETHERIINAGLECMAALTAGSKLVKTIIITKLS